MAGVDQPVSTKPVDLWAIITSVVEIRADLDGCDYVEIDRTSVSNLEVALRPWLRDPVGCELDVTWEEIEQLVYSAPLSSRSVRVLDLCRSRTRPVYECKECVARREHMLTAPEVKCAECELRSDEGLIQALMGERDQWMQEAQDAIKLKDRALIAWQKLAHYECKECAKVKGASMAYVENIEGSCRSARAALEGE